MTQTVIEPQIETVSLVVLGAFNPAIMHPFWLAQNQLISTSEAEDADIDMIVPEVAQFRLPWLSYQCVRRRLIVETPDPSKSLVIRDLIVGVLDILEHTPIDQFGLNYSIQLAMPSPEAWRRLGGECAPANLWQKHMKNPTMNSLVIQGDREQSESAYCQVRIESVGTHNVAFRLNEHYNFEDESGDRAKRDNLRRIADGLQSFITYSKNLMMDIIDPFFSDDGEVSNG